MKRALLGVAASVGLVLFGWATYRWQCPRDLFGGYRADAGISSSNVAGEAAAMRRPSRLLRCCPRVTSYAVDFEIAGIESSRASLVYSRNEGGSGRLGFESGLSGLRPPAFQASVEDIHRHAATGRSLRGFPLETR
jgi:hypothetical protein